MLNVEIVTPQRIVYNGIASAVSVPGAKSPFQILTNHVPIVSSLVQGDVRVKEANGTETIFEISSGILEMHDNTVSVIVESAVAKA